MSKLFTQSGFVADDVFEYRDLKTGELQRVPIHHCRVGERNFRLGESVAKMKNHIQTKDSASRDDIRDRLISQLERQTRTLDLLIERLEGEAARAAHRYTVDHNAPPNSPHSYEAILRHFRRPPSKEADAAADFVAKATRHHRKESVRPEEQPVGAVRTADSEDETEAQEFQRKARQARGKMLGKK